MLAKLPQSADNHHQTPHGCEGNQDHRKGCSARVEQTTSMESCVRGSRAGGSDRNTEDFFFWLSLPTACRIPVPQPGIEPGSEQCKPRIAPSRPAANSPWSFLRGCVCSNHFPVFQLVSFLITKVLRVLCIFCTRFVCERCFYKHFLPVHGLCFHLLSPMQRRLSFQ